MRPLTCCASAWKPLRAPPHCTSQRRPRPRVRAAGPSPLPIRLQCQVFSVRGLKSLALGDTRGLALLGPSTTGSSGLEGTGFPPGGRCNVPGNNQKVSRRRVPQAACMCWLVVPPPHGPKEACCLDISHLEGHTDLVDSEDLSLDPQPPPDGGKV